MAGSGKDDMHSQRDENRGYGDESEGLLRIPFGNAVCTVEEGIPRPENGLRETFDSASRSACHPETASEAGAFQSDSVIDGERRNGGR